MEKFDGLSFYGHEDKELQKEYERMFCNMTQEEKQLLLKDLCARLPYGGVTCGTKSSNYKPVFYATISDSTYLLRYIEHDELKPYLRSMSSMTEEEKKERDFYCQYKPYDEDIEESYLTEYDMPDYIDFLLEHHFDYRGLIKKGLALEAPEGMYKINKIK